MGIDPNNPVVMCCAEGIQLEMEGKIAEATTCYLQAWEIRKNDYESCIIAHYIARIQNTPEDILHWNLEALAYADKVNDESVAAFYPSLFLNIGKAYEHLDKSADAESYYQRGAARVNALPDDRLGNITRDALNRGLERVGR